MIKWRKLEYQQSWVGERDGQRAYRINRRKARAKGGGSRFEAYAETLGQDCYGKPMYCGGDDIGWNFRTLAEAKTECEGRAARPPAETAMADKARAATAPRPSSERR